jgi:hypothetical protein
VFLSGGCDTVGGKMQTDATLGFELRTRACPMMRNIGGVRDQFTRVPAPNHPAPLPPAPRPRPRRNHRPQPPQPPPRRLFLNRRRPQQHHLPRPPATTSSASNGPERHL